MTPRKAVKKIWGWAGLRWVTSGGDCSRRGGWEQEIAENAQIY